ncbi:MAG: galactose-1-phosphate uridylyltransferase [Microthrixaceae bacterium]|nr:galactose-1-phosphate uridylyltransferase [Microthrixaceae bacterium]
MAAPYDRRVDPLTGEAAVIVAKRQARPNLGEGVHTRSSGCPFCPGGIEAPDDYDVKAFPNRWPSISDGRCEVVLYTSDHDATFASLGVAGARKVVDLWAERTAHLGARDDVHYVLVFENRGPEVGATIPHPHGQIYAFPEVPPAPRRELEGASCALCGVDPGDRLVSQAGGWRAWVPDAATWPYSLLVAAVAHEPDLPALGPDERDGLAATLVDVLGRLDALFDAPMPYMLWFHQRPSDGGPWPTAHLHLHLAPLYRSPGTQRYVAAGELGSGMFFNPVDPVDAAAALRAAGAGR